MDETFYDDYKEALLDIIDSNIPIVYNLNVGHATPRAIVPFGVHAYEMQRSKSFALIITNKAGKNFSAQIEVIRRLLLFIFLNSENWVTRYSK